MASSPIVLGHSLPSTEAPVAGKAPVISWYLWCGVAAVLSANIGLSWDVSWHRSIGRDTFWTPAHMMIYACGLLAGIFCGYLILSTTFVRSSPLRSASVNVLWLRGPLGAFVAAWGGIAMLLSAPFDNWWHSAYGLDVKIVSPPHTLLFAGLRAISVGVLFLLLATMNRAAEDKTSLEFRASRRLFLLIGGLMVGGQMFFLQEFTADAQMHQVIPYILITVAVMPVLAIISQASRYRWAASTAAAVYTVYLILEILILPLFPAHPKLGPVYFPVTHMVPAEFPPLIVVPAFALDLLWQRTRNWKFWQIALVSSVVFVAVFAFVEWPFATFLLSKASRNRFFGTMYFDTRAMPASAFFRRVFIRPEYGTHFALGLLRAALFGSVVTFIGLRWGRWMRGLQR